MRIAALVLAVPATASGAMEAVALAVESHGQESSSRREGVRVSDLLAARHSEGGVLLVTHRPARLAAADEVVVLGRSSGPATVLARGSHKHLLETLPSYRWAVEQQLR